MFYDSYDTRSESDGQVELPLGCDVEVCPDIFGCIRKLIWVCPGYRSSYRRSNLKCLEVVDSSSRVLYRGMWIPRGVSTVHKSTWEALTERSLVSFNAPVFCFVY
jgi:hypothetical protein